MFHVINENKLYDLINEIETKIDVYRGKEKYNICQLLDDVSIWAEKNRVLIDDKYLPLATLAVGVAPSTISAFVYGYFVGKAVEKNKLSILIKKSPINKKTILKKINKSGKFYDNLFENLGDNKEKKK